MGSERTLFLDLDGVLIPSHEIHAAAVERALHEWGVRDAVVGADERTAEALARFDNRDRITTPRDAESFQELKDWWLYHLARTMGAMLQGRAAEATWRVVTAVKRLEFAGVAIVTSTPEPAASMLWRAFAGELAEEVGWTVYGRLPHHRTKPAPDVYDRALNMTGWDPDRTTAMEDEPRGVEAARAAGITEILEVRNPGEAAWYFESLR